MTEEELCRECANDDFWRGYQEGREGRDALLARIAELKAALRPFADEADTYNRRDDARDHIDQCGGLTVADLRAARAAYKGEKND